MNIQGLLKLGDESQLPQISPGTPDFKQSSFQGGRVEVGAPAQQVGPSGAEAMYGALAEIAGSVSKGIDTFAKIGSDIEKKRIEEAKLKFKKIYATEYEGDVTPESKLSDWNTYAKEVWTPLLGTTWLDDMHIDAYTSFGSKEAQDKFEETRYKNEATNFFSDPKNATRLNQNSSFALKEFDNYYLSKYPVAAGNRWFKQTQQANIASGQNEQDAIATQGLDASLTTILRLPPVEIIDSIVSGGPEADKQKGIFSAFFDEVLPLVENLEDKDIPNVIYKYYVDKLITENPNKYNEHTLVTLRQRLPYAILPRVEAIRELRVAKAVAEQKKTAEVQLAAASLEMNTPQTYNTGSYNLFKAVILNSPFIGIPEAKQPEAITSAVMSIWEAGINTTDNSLSTPVKITGIKPELSEVAYKYFPTLEKEGFKTNLNSLSPTEQVEYLSGAMLTQVVSTDPVLTERLMKIYKATSIDELYKKFQVSVRSMVATSKTLQAANQARLEKKNVRLGLAINTLSGNSNIEDIQTNTTEFTVDLANMTGLPHDIFRGIYIRKTEDGKENLNPNWDIDEWYASKTPEQRKVIDDSGVMFGPSKSTLEQAVIMALSLEAATLKQIGTLKESIAKGVEASTKALDAELEQAAKLNKQGRRFSINPDEITAEQSQGSLTSSVLDGSIRSNNESVEMLDMLKAMHAGFTIIQNTPPGQELSAEDRMVVGTLNRLVGWRESGNPELVEAANRMFDFYRVMEESVSQSLASIGPVWQSIDAGLSPDSDPKDRAIRFKELSENFRRDFFNGELPAYNGDFDIGQALDSEGRLTAYAFRFLAQTSSLTYQYATTNDTRNAGNTSSDRLAKMSKQLWDKIGLDPTPENFVRNKANILPYLAIVLQGRALSEAEASGKAKPLIGHAGWFNDRMAIMANLAVGVNPADAANYFTSEEWRRSHGYILDFPYNLAYQMRGTNSTPDALFVAGAPDQLNMLKRVPNQNRVIGISAVSQPKQNSLVSPDATKVAATPESIEQALNAIIDGSTVSPLDETWSPDFALKAWQKAGLVQEGTTKEVFARDLAAAFLEGSILPESYSADQTIRMAFEVIHNIEKTRPRFLDTIIGMATSETIGIGTEAYPLGTTTSKEFLGFLAASAGMHSAMQTASWSDDKTGSVYFNGRHSNLTTVQRSTDGHMTTFFTVRGRDLASSYDVSRLVGFLDNSRRRNPEDPQSFIFKEENPRRRFRPNISIEKGKQVFEDGPQFQAGTILLESKPSPNILMDILSPYIENTIPLSGLGFSVQFPLILINDEVFQEAAKKTTVFDSLLYIHDHLVEARKTNPSIPLFLDEKKLFSRSETGTFDRTRTLDGVATITQNFNQATPEAMAFTFPFVNVSFSGKPLLHLPNKIWSYDLDVNTDPYVQDLAREKARMEERLKAAEKQTQRNRQSPI